MPVQDSYTQSEDYDCHPCQGLVQQGMSVFDNPVKEILHNFLEALGYAYFEDERAIGIINLLCMYVLC